MIRFDGRAKYKESEFLLHLQPKNLSKTNHYDEQTTQLTYFHL